MITKWAGEDAVSARAEDADDLLALRRVIRAGDSVAADTTRVIKRDREHSRPDKGERVRIRIAMQVERISLDSSLERLRIGGMIHESSNESVPHGSHHSIILGIGDGVTVSKRRWSATERRLLGRGGGGGGFVLVAMDASECGIARLRGTHLRMLPNIYSGRGGKRYRTNYDAGDFFGRAWQALGAALGGQDRVVLFGPGETKRRFANFLKGVPGAEKLEVTVAEGADSGGEDGIHTFTKSGPMRDIMAGSKLAEASGVIDAVMALAGRGSARFTMGFEETRAACRAGAIESLAFSERAVQENDEQEVVDMLNEAEAAGARVLAVDSTTDIGLRVGGLGGVVSLLRYPLAS